MLGKNLLTCSQDKPLCQQVPVEGFATLSWAVTARVTFGKGEHGTPLYQISRSTAEEVILGQPSVIEALWESQAQREEAELDVALIAIKEAGE